MRRLLFALPSGQRYSCRRCTSCCRWWRIEVDPTDRDRILAHDWAAESPRLRGIQLFEEVQLPDRTDPVIETTRIDGRCVFLEGDGLCLIHRVLGPEAKPTVCQGFPLVLGRTVEGMLVGASYGCSAVVRNEGEPFARQESVVLDLLDRLGDGMVGGETVIEPEPLLSGRTRMDWRGYLQIERSLLEILARRDQPVASRLAAGKGLVGSTAARFSGKGRVREEEVSGWLEEQRDRDYASAFARAAASRPVSPRRLRATLAPLIARVEMAPLEREVRDAAVAGYVAAIDVGVGRIHLSTLDGSLELTAMGKLRYDEDSPRFNDYLTRFLCNFVIRKSLLESRSLQQGCDRLILLLALVGWYARASAALVGRAQVGEEDVIAGMQVVEKGYARVDPPTRIGGRRWG